MKESYINEEQNSGSTKDSRGEEKADRLGNQQKQADENCEGKSDKKERHAGDIEATPSGID